MLFKNVLRRILKLQNYERVRRELGGEKKTEDVSENGDGLFIFEVQKHTIKLYSGRRQNIYRSYESCFLSYGVIFVHAKCL